jgi:hypothetical protein
MGFHLIRLIGNEYVKCIDFRVWIYCGNYDNRCPGLLGVIK